MFEDRRSPEAKAEANRRLEADRLERERHKTTRDEWRERCWGNLPWQLIESCPFEAFDSSYELEGSILVTDGENVAQATVKKRFGRPYRVKVKPKMVMTDRGFAWEGGEYEEIDAPAWWFEWKLTDVFGHENYAGGEPVGKDAVDFVPTHWLPLPGAKPSTPEG